MNKHIDINLLNPHPLNREFDRMGEGWKALVESIRTHGVIQPLLVRLVARSRYEIIAGHRRLAAAKEASVETIECVVRKMSDLESLEVMVIENLERENPDPVEEGKLLCALEAEGVKVEALAQRLKRSVLWITTRQRLLDLGEEVIEAVRKPKDAVGHLGIGTVEILLSVMPEERGRAIQMVLHPEWTDEVLGPREAAELIRTTILEPSRRKAAWEKEVKTLVKAWRKDLGMYLTKSEKKDLVVQALRWEEFETCRMKTGAHELIPTNELSDATEQPRWVNLAIVHGLPIWIIPASGDGAESEAVVDERLIRLAEEARVDNGLSAILLSPKQLRRKVSVGNKESIGTEVPTKDASTAVEKAVANLDGEVDPDFNTEEPVRKVIDQQMQSSAWVDLGAVRKIREQMKDLQWPVSDLPDDAPDWLVSIWNGQADEQVIVQLCDWFLGLNR